MLFAIFLKLEIVSLRQSDSQKQQWRGFLKFIIAGMKLKKIDPILVLKEAKTWIP